LIESVPASSNGNDGRPSHNEGDRQGFFVSRHSKPFNRRTVLYAATKNLSTGGNHPIFIVPACDYL
jgi:hypothetical protein